MRRKVFDAVVTVGEYADKKSGTVKKQYRTVGAVLQDEDGKMSLKLEMIPATGFNGWINFYEPRDGEQKPKPQAPANDGFDDDINF
jgi:hypothetical protein